MEDDTFKFLLTKELNHVMQGYENSKAELTEEMLQDYEFAIVMIGRVYPHRAESMSIRLRDYREKNIK